MSPKSGPTRLRELLQQPGIICSLGAHDVFTALIVEQAGFETVFIGGFGTSASMLGLPDLNFLTMSEMADAVRRMAARVCIPVIADADTGYGDLHNVQRTVEAFKAAGASGILLEDQVIPKRCGHFADKRVIPNEEMVLKIKAAVKARALVFEAPRSVRVADVEVDRTSGKVTVKHITLAHDCGLIINPDGLLNQVKREAEQRGETVTALIEQGLRLVLAQTRTISQKEPVKLPVSAVGGGVLPGVDLNDSAALRPTMSAWW